MNKEPIIRREISSDFEIVGTVLGYSPDDFTVSIVLMDGVASLRAGENVIRMWRKDKKYPDYNLHVRKVTTEKIKTFQRLGEIR